MGNEPIDWGKFKIKSRPKKTEEHMNKVSACLRSAGMAIQKGRIIAETGMTDRQVTRILRKMKKAKKIFIVRVGVRRRKYQTDKIQRHIYFGLR